jgi:L,D-transpeptidase ErfK/SrfK
MFTLEEKLKTSMSHSKSTAFRPSLLIVCTLLGSALAGCQIMPSFGPSEAPPAAASLPKQENIESHNFQLADGQNIVGSLATVDIRENDTLPDIARHYGLGYNDITIANARLDPWTPQPGSQALLPLRFILPEAPHKGIVLNLANMRLFFYPQKQPNTLFTYPVGIGRQGWNTPMGSTKIVSKRANPTWTVPESIQREHAEKGDTLPKVVRSGPDNPLGKYAMPLGFPGYLIHGTNKPYGIGMQISHGCVQLYPEDIEVLFNKSKVGMPVQIVHQPYLAAWDQDMLYLEAHEPLQKWAKQKPKLKKKLVGELKRISTEQNVSIDWEKVDRIIERADGIPTPILAGSPDIAELTTAAVQLDHPEQLYGQPVVEELKESDWALLAATFDNETEAQQLAAMLSHQGPPIPARKMEKDGVYQVIAGPFKNKKEVKTVAQRIRMDFELDAKPLKPGKVN